MQHEQDAGGGLLLLNIWHFGKQTAKPERLGQVSYIYRGSGDGVVAA